MSQFHKYQALGNDMIVLEPGHFPAWPQAGPPTAAVRMLCHRHLGIGADGICYGPLAADQGPPWRMRFFNPDGSEAEKSGNGLRIFARYLRDAGYVSDPQFTIAMGQEVLPVQIENTAATRITTGLGRLVFQAEQAVETALVVAGQSYQAVVVSIGNPHCVIFQPMVDERLARQVGPLVELDPHFPERTNVQFARMVDEHTLQIEIWERGAGYTLASGSSAAAAAGAAVRTGRCHSPVEVCMAGGVARVAIDADWSVRLSGTVRAVCQGELAPDLLDQLQGV